MDIQRLRAVLPLLDIPTASLNSMLEQIDDVVSRLFPCKDPRCPLDLQSVDDEAIANPLLSMALHLRRSNCLSDESLLSVRNAVIECADDVDQIRSVEAELAMAAATNPISDYLDRELVARLQGGTGNTPKGERDPSGIDAHSPGAKLDAGKNRCALVIGGFSAALWQVSRVGTFGAAKYTPNGWKEVEGGIERYTDAMARHLLAEAMGEDLDSESGLLHAAHAAWNALARLELMLKGGAHG